MGVKNIQGTLKINDEIVATVPQVEQLSEKIEALPQADWSQIDEIALDFIKNKPILALVATSGLIEDLLMSWDTLLIFDGGDADVQLAVLDETILL